MNIRNHQYQSASPIFYATNPALQSLPSSTAAEHQVHRWANWLKFVAVFLIIGSLLNSLKILFFHFASTELSSSILIQAIAFHLVHFGIGCIGYRTAVKKNLKSAKTMLTNLLIGIISSTILVVSILNEVLMSLCKFNGGNCSEEEISTLAFEYGLYFLLFAMIICSPVIYCLEMMMKHAQTLEESRRFSYPNQIVGYGQGNSYYFPRV